MNKTKIFLTFLMIAPLNTAIFASDDYRHDLGLVGPNRYQKVKTVGKANETDFQEIQRNNEQTLKTDVSLQDLDRVFAYPTSGKGYVTDIFNQFKGTQGENPVIEAAQEILPEGKVLCVHRFHGDKTEEGHPVQLTLKATVDKEKVQTYEAQTTVVGEKSGFKFTFKQTINLMTGGKPTISLKEEEVKANDKKETQPITNGVMHVAIYSAKKDIPTSTGATSAIRQKFNLPSEIRD
jgi:hypothetical protein